MPGLLSNCEDMFDCSDLYTLFELDRNKTISQQAIKRAYYKKSLQVHPDRVEEHEKEEATRKFQVLGAAYAILSDEEKRKAYDETGAIDEEDGGPPGGGDWEQYWRLLYKKISLSDIQQFEQKYKGSDEERDDLFAAYDEGEGDMDYILETVLCCSCDDEERFAELLRAAIADGRLESHKAFVKESKAKAAARHRRARGEAMEAKEAAAELKLDGSEASLRQALQQRGQQRAAQMGSFFDNLEKKYAPKAKSKKKTPKR